MNNPTFEIYQRLNNLIRLATVIEVDADKAKARVEFGDIKTNWLYWLATKAGENITYCTPEVGEQVLLLSPYGDYNQGIILLAIYQNKFKPPERKENIKLVKFKDGTLIKYDTDKKELNINSVADIIINADGKNIKVKNKDTNQQCEVLNITAKSVNITADQTTITGKLHVTENITTDADTIASGVSLVKHTHTSKGKGAKTTPP